MPALSSTHSVVQVSPMWDGSIGGNDTGILSDVLGVTVKSPIRPLLDGGILTSSTRHIQAGQSVPHHVAPAGQSHTYTLQCCIRSSVPRSNLTGV